MAENKQKLALHYTEKIAVKDITPQEAGKLVFEEYSKVLRNAEVVSALKEMTYDQVKAYWKSSNVDDRCIRRRDKEMDFVEKEKLPFYAFYYDVGVKVKVAFFSKVIKSPEIQSVILNPETGTVRVMDLYTQLQRFDSFINLYTDEKTGEMTLEVLAELDIQKIVFLPKFLDTPFINSIMEKLNILKLQRDIVVNLVSDQIKNNIVHFSREGLIPKIDSRNVKLVLKPVIGDRVIEGEYTLDDVFKPLWNVKLEG